MFKIHTTIWSVFPVLLIAFIFAVATLPSSAQDATNGDHPRIEESPELSAEEAERIYSELKEAMREGYLLARYTLEAKYQSWPRYSKAPYLSQAHGNRYLNNYANSKEFDFASPKPGIAYPAGTLLAKDSFTVTQNGKVFPGSLFIMEKLSSGRSPETADWRYLAIHPDGSIEGDTVGELPEGVVYCHQCHQQRAEFDYVFGIDQ